MKRVLLTLAFAVAAAGCAEEPAETSSEDEGVEAAALEASPEEGRAGRHGKHHTKGPAFLFDAALGLDLTDAQRSAIEAAKLELQGKHPRGHEGHEEGRAALARAIRAGNVDPTAAPEPDGADRHTRTVAAMEKLHATLTPDQRAALVESVLAKKKHGGEHRGSKRDRGHEGGRKDPLAFLLRGLDVGDEQRARIETALREAGLERPTKDRAEHERAKDRRRALLEGFASEDFDAGQLLPVGSPQARQERMLKALSVIVPLLDEQQREALAARIEAGPAKTK